MRRTLKGTTAGLLVFVVVLVAAALGYLLREHTDSPEPITTEAVLSQVPRTPRLPAFDPGAGWSALPRPPAPARSATSAENIEPSAIEEVEPTEVYEPVEESTGSGEGERCYGITFGPTC
jgi:hypothetical protein